MSDHGLTRARTMGPIAEAIRTAGGSLARVFGRAGMPLTLLDTPDRLILLRDQLTLVEAAIREIGDPSLPARLSTATGIAGLGPIGVQVRLSATLGAAVQRVEVVTPLLLQTATWTGLHRRRADAFYGYAVTERIEAGRQANEVLALGYLLGTVRHFLGAAWRPERAVVTGAHLAARREIEDAFGCEIALGPRAGLVFPIHHLEAPNPNRLDASEAADDTPIGSDFGTCVAHLIELGLDEARPSIDGIAGRLGLSRRTLQRRLEAEGTGYAEIQRRVLIRRARALLAVDRLPIGRIGLELGYADAAHFSRAFLEWTGLTPRQWRSSLRNGPPA
ncbi:AraC family transcriptional regulator [Methylobacterium sp. Leaf456]|uniref:AraC family transcriptional regulator n=1 Tax=Methylobacterium sp. Leaf456 TaxID=1736382 RepID=UPI0006F9B18E|nr:AraC family transcriptional regulator [Methylobacterium sp. Leaf456]KQT46716.1 AraC family transcriptional regulator [Methylobacterium sp. Leaf456]